MKKLLALIGLSLSMVACKSEMSGNLSLVQPMKKVKWDYSSCKKGERFVDCRKAQGYLVNIPTGDHGTILRMETERRMHILAAGQKLEVILPRGTKIPANNGRLSLSGFQTGSPFHFDVNVETDYSRSREHRDFESCTYYVEERVCERVKVGENCDSGDTDGPGRRPGKEPGKRPGKKPGRKNGELALSEAVEAPATAKNCQAEYEKVCEWKQVPRTGERKVRYYFEYATRNVKIDVKEEPRKNYLGVFTGATTTTEKIYTFEGRCF